MKVLFIVRLFSGFERSVSERRWIPAGTPTIYKLIDALAKDSHEMEYVFTCKAVSWVCSDPSDREVEIEGLPGQTTVLAGEARFPEWLGRLRWYFYELRQVWRALKIYRRSRPDLIYVDRGNMWIAGILARLIRVPVVYRVMGISPGFRHIAAGNRPQQIVSRWLVRAPFGAVLCSEDGSGGEMWLDRMLRPDVPRAFLLHGVVQPDSLQTSTPETWGMPRDRTIVLFVGRLETLKGCDEFIEGFLKASERQPEALHALIVGGGPREKALRVRVSEAGAERTVTFTGELTHARVLNVYAQADIYVSLNRMCNLTNTNVEALSAGCCAIFPASQPGIGADLRTDQIFPPDTVMRIPHVEDTDALAAALLHLHSDGEERQRRAKAIARIAEQTFSNWDERIQHEISMLSSVAQSKSHESLSTASQVQGAGIKFEL